MAISGGDGSIILTTQVDTKGLNQGMSSVKNSAKSLTSSLKGLAVAVGAAFSVKAIVDFSAEASKSAAATEASIDRLIDTYGEASKSLGDFIDANANALGMSKDAAAQFSAVYGNLFSVWADQATNADLTTQYLNMTAVVATKTGRSMEDVQERIRSGLLGNTEAVEDLGIFVNVKTIEMTDAFKRVADGRSWEQLNAYEQSQIRALAILEQSTQKYGNTVEQSNALARSQYTAAFEEFQNTWGTVVNYILMPVLNILTQVFQYATSALQALFNISGKTIDVDAAAFSEVSTSIGDSVDNQDDLTESVKETEKAQKKLLAGFDTAQILSQETAENSNQNAGGVPSTSTAPTAPAIQAPQISDLESNWFNIDSSGFENLKLIFENIKNTIVEIKNNFLTGFWRSFQNADFSSLTTSIKNIKTSLNGIFTSTEVSTSVQNFINSASLAFGQTTGSILSIGTTIATNLTTGFSNYLTNNEEFIKTKVSSIFDASSKLSISVGNMWTSFSNIFSVLADENGIKLTENITSIFSNSALSIVEIATKLGGDFMTNLSQVITDNEEGLSLTLDGVLGLFSGLTGSIKEVVEGFYDDMNVIYDENIKPLIDSLGEGISGWVTTFTDAWNEDIKPILDNLAQKFDETCKDYVKPALSSVTRAFGRMLNAVKALWENWLQPFVNWLIQKLAPIVGKAIGLAGRVFNTLFRTVSKVVEGLGEALTGFADFLTGVFSGDWELAWQGLKDTFSGIWDAITGAIDVLKDSFSEAWDNVKIWWEENCAEYFTMEYWKGLGKDILNGLIWAFESGINGIISAFETLINAIVSAVNKLSFDVPDWVPGIGGNSFGFNLSKADFGEVKIPRLAQGMVIPGNREFLAVLGDQPAGQTNIEAPLQTIVDAFNIALQNSAYRGGGNTEVVLELNAREFGRAVIEQGNLENRRIGTRLVMA